MRNPRISYVGLPQKLPETVGWKVVSGEEKNKGIQDLNPSAFRNNTPFRDDPGTSVSKKSTGYVQN
jgi:hypothetical protein